MDLYSLDDKLNITSFKVANSSQAQSGGSCKGGGGYRGGRMGGIIRIVMCYNYDKVGHIAWDFPLLS